MHMLGEKRLFIMYHNGIWAAVKWAIRSVSGPKYRETLSSMALSHARRPTVAACVLALYREVITTAAHAPR
jgi:hypothetical protein